LLPCLLESFIAAGPIMATLAGLGVGGMVGGITGALIAAGIPEYEPKRYEGRLGKGGILLSVHCDRPDEIAHAKQINGTHGRGGYLGRRRRDRSHSQDWWLAVHRAFNGLTNSFISN
jgi:hypothetical protein